MTLECPECGAKLEVPANHPTRPFCSARCKLIDLGRWFSEDIRLPIQSAPADLEDEAPLDVN
jgi:endogenous inhibitor of DNA gyrase (YacG/DUF329 family)